MKKYIKTRILGCIRMSSKGDKPKSGDGFNPFERLESVRIADQVPESKHLLERSDADSLLTHVKKELGDSLTAVAVYNSSTIEYYSYKAERMAQYSKEDLEALTEDRLLQIRREDELQESLHKFHNYQYRVDGYQNGTILRIRFTSSTGVIILINTCEDISLPEFPSRLLEEVNLDIPDKHPRFENAKNFE